MTRHIYVNHGADGTGDGTTRDLTGPNSAYNTIADAESDVTGTLTEPYRVWIAGAETPPNVASIWAGFTADAVNNVEIRADEDEDHTADGGAPPAGLDDGRYFGDLSWSTSHARISSTGNTLRIQTFFTSIYDLQIESLGGNVNVYALYLEVCDDNTFIRNCRFKGPAAINAAARGLYIPGSSITRGYNLESCIFSLMYSPLNAFTFATANTRRLYNNTATNVRAGWLIASGAAVVDTQFHNNAVYECQLAEYTGLDLDGVTASHCAGEDAEPAGHGAGYQQITGADFVGYNADPELSDVRRTEGGLLDGTGTTGGPATDIADNPFDLDIGAWAVPETAAPVGQIYQTAP